MIYWRLRKEYYKLIKGSAFYTLKNFILSIELHSEGFYNDVQNLINLSICLISTNVNLNQSLNKVNLLGSLF